MTTQQILSTDVGDDANNNIPVFSAVGEEGYFPGSQVFSLVLVSCLPALRLAPSRSFVHLAESPPSIS